MKLRAARSLALGVRRSLLRPGGALPATGESNALHALPAAQLRLTTCVPTRGASKHVSSDHEKLRLRDTGSGISVHETAGYVSTMATETMEPVHLRARRLREQGRVREALRVLDVGRAHKSARVTDLLEVLRTVRDMNRVLDNRGSERYPSTTLFEQGKVPSQAKIQMATRQGPSTLDEMLYVVQHSPAPRNRSVYNLLLNECAMLSARIERSANVLRARDTYLHIASRIWAEMIRDTDARIDRSTTPDQGVKPRSTCTPDTVTVLFMYRICGSCRGLDLARDVFRFAQSHHLQREGSVQRNSHTRPLHGSSNASAQADALMVAAAYLVCLGKCGRSGEAEALLYTSEYRSYREHPVIVEALFRSHLASQRVERADALIERHGASFLTLPMCNMYLAECSRMSLRHSSIALVNRMEKDANVPSPNEQTYELLVSGLCSSQRGEDAKIGLKQAFEVVNDMADRDLIPTTRTYNVLIRNLVSQGQVEMALQVYGRMSNPDHLTASHLMRGAALTADSQLAHRLKAEMKESSLYPNYRFCKYYLEAIARAEGSQAALRDAQEMSVEYEQALQTFRDVGPREAVRMALIHAFGSSRDLPAAFEALRLPLHGSEDKVGARAPLYIATSLMQACIDCEEYGQAIEVFHSMKRAQLSLNSDVYERLIYGLASARDDGTPKTLPEQHVRPFVDVSEAIVHEVAAGAYDELLASDSGDGDDTLSVSKVDEQSRTASARLTYALDIALSLLHEMHTAGVARVSRPVASVYNALITAAGQVGDLTLALQLFMKMTPHHNVGIVYVANNADAEYNTAHSGKRYSELFVADSRFEFPSATTTTYNAMMHAAHVCDRPSLAFKLFDQMVVDRMCEPGTNSLSILADVALLRPDAVEARDVQRLLKALDGLRFMPDNLRTKHAAIRKLLLNMRWSGRKGDEG